jgi:hypothetical protein
MRRWTGPRPSDLEPNGVTLRWSVPSERWPYGPPSAHENCCSLRPPTFGKFCDCKASAADDDEHGEAP